VNNTFDYSSRFDTAAGQAYKIDTAGQSVAFSNALTSVGGTLTKLGAGMLILAGANTYNGGTTVSGGKLVIPQLAGAGSITVADGTALGFTENESQITPSTLTVGTNASATLEFNNVTNTTLPPIVAGTISAASPITINVNSGSFNTIGQSFPLLQWNSGFAPAGPGIWILTGTNSYSGLTTINSGLLQIGVGGGSGTIGTGNIDDNGGLDFNRTGTLTVPGAITGAGTPTNDGSGTLILAGNNTYPAERSSMPARFKLEPAAAAALSIPAARLSITARWFSIAKLSSRFPVSAPISPAPAMSESLPEP